MSIGDFIQDLLRRCYKRHDGEAHSFLEFAIIVGFEMDMAVMQKAITREDVNKVKPILPRIYALLGREEEERNR